MSVARQFDLVDIDTYLSLEAESPTRHEYIGGVLYAMSGGPNRHSLLSQVSGVSCAAIRAGPTDQTPRSGYEAHETFVFITRTRRLCVARIRPKTFFRTNLW